MSFRGQRFIVEEEKGRRVGLVLNPLGGDLSRKEDRHEEDWWLLFMAGKVGRGFRP